MSRPKCDQRLRTGRTQLSLVEHALFPLDQNLRGKPLIHTTSYPIYRRSQAPLTCSVEVHCSRGISPYDEYLLYGLLGLAFAETDQSPVFYATTNWILTRLALDNGGAGYRQIDEALSRLEVVTYTAKNFYHPMKGEIAKRISFGFVKRYVPLENEDERGWKFIFDQQSFELAQHTHGRMRFPFELYGRYTPPARRLFLFLRKFFYRHTTTPRFNIEYLHDTVLGLNASHPPWQKKRELSKYVRELLDTEVIELSPGNSDICHEFIKLAKGQYCIAFNRGANGETNAPNSGLQDTALYTMLESLKISPSAIREVLNTCKSSTTKEWIQIAFAAKARGIINSTPAAYFMDNIRKARAGKRGVPDWWLELKREEERRQWDQTGGRVLRAHLREHAEAHGMSPPTFEEYVRTAEAQQSFDRVFDQVFHAFRNAGNNSEQEAREIAERHAHSRLKAAYRDKYDISDSGLPKTVSDILRDPDVVE